MVVLDNWKGKLNNITKTLTKTSGELIKTTKISLEVANEEENLKSLYVDIGKKVHEIYLYGGSLGKFFDEKYQEIIRLESKLNELKGRLSDIKGTFPCPKCGKVIEKNSEFCPKCGLKISEKLILETSVVTESVETQPEIIKPYEVSEAPTEEGKICPICGSKNNKSSTYCLSCGRII